MGDAVNRHADTQVTADAAAPVASRAGCTVDASTRDPAAPFIAADVGGTHARVGLVVRSRAGDRAVRMLHYHRYRCAEWVNLTALLRDFIAELAAMPALATVRVRRCVVACAGYVLDDCIVNGNLPWPVSIRDIRARLGISQLAVINDFAAVAHAAPCVGATASRSIVDAPAPEAGSPVLVMGPGTGLGSAVLLPGVPRARVLATEAGQVSLAPGNEREIAILRVLLRGRTYVAYEHALSGPGLLNLYRAIAELDGRTATLTTPAAVSRAALAGDEASALEAVQVFCGLLGSFVGDLVLLYGARGGVFLAGGILPQILPLLLTSTFAERYFNKGVMRPYLQQVPVRLIEHGQLGVIGAALWYLDERSEDDMTPMQ